MSFQAVYRRHTPFALELFTYPLFNGSFRLQKVGDVLLYAYLFTEENEFNWRSIQSISFYIGGQEIDTWDSFYLNTLHPVLLSQYSGFAPDQTPHFLPIPIPMLPTKNMRFHEIEIVVRPPLDVTLNAMFAFVDEEIPDCDILYHRVSKQAVQPNVPFSLYGAAKFITSSDAALDTIRIDRDYTIAPMNIQFMHHSRTKTFQYLGRNTVSFDVGIKTLYAEAGQTSLNIFGYDVQENFVYTRVDYNTQKRVETKYLGKLTVLKVIDGKYIVTPRNVIQVNIPLLVYSIQTVDVFTMTSTSFTVNATPFGVTETDTIQIALNTKNTTLGVTLYNPVQVSDLIKGITITGTFSGSYFIFFRYKGNYIQSPFGLSSTVPEITSIQTFTMTSTSLTVKATSANIPLDGLVNILVNGVYINRVSASQLSSGITVSGTFTGGMKSVSFEYPSGVLLTSPSKTFELPLYEFTSFTFTTAGKSGSIGPTLGELRSAYSAVPWTQDTSFFNIQVQGIQLWTVPKTGTYQIVAAGAGGSVTSWTNGNNSGKGVIIKNTYNLEISQKLKILVGQVGTVGNQSYGACGGTYISTDTNSPILVAGGGGGGAFGGGGGNATENCTAGGLGGVAIGQNGAGAGGGFFTNGQNGQVPGGSAFISGAGAGTQNSGFGGGGGSRQSKGGGGGGYTGGSTNALGTGGVGGGSYDVNGLNNNATLFGIGFNSGPGFVTINYIE